MAEAVGIDLGTMYSCAAFVTNGKVEVIQADDSGKRVVPSCVAFVGEEELVGDGALAKARRDPTKVIYDAKRLIGRSYNEQSVQDDIEKWPFKVVDSEGRPTIQVEHKGQTKSIVAEEVSAMVLRKLIADATKRIGQEVKKAVITVPAYFTDSQKRATKEAARMAGIEVLRLLPEPTAAAVAYGRENKGLENHISGQRNVLIYDLGGGTFDVSILAIDGKHYCVKGVGGHSHLGGGDFDQLIYTYVAEEVKRKLRIDVCNDPKKKRKLLTMCERAKRDVASMVNADIEIGSLVGSDDVLEIDRHKVEELCKNLLEDTKEVVKNVLATAKMTPADIDEVILVGGSTRMPCIKEMLSKVFPGKPICKTVNADEVVACGAAHLAAIISRDKGALLDVVQLENALPLSIGVEVFRGVFDVVIPRNTAIPVRCTRRYQTGFDNQSAVSFSVFQGERPLTKKNKFIGTFLLENVPPSRAGMPLEMVLAIDEDGILAVEAKVWPSKNCQSCSLQLTDRKTTEIISNLEDAERYMEEDQREVARLKKRSDLETYIENCRDHADGQVGWWLRLYLLDC
ncbi:hypothetical protein ONE63_005009 [Megalurothrips usitatus]|uniref:Uncharacterized protein n=1 Tax=Megalurothrips usitatus TaxID=439358 RepID=A0AAV7X4N4_9NEOP|nr:hypothetical protein ONE63_005009 [Megalurothrips usitatus]